eukprot:2137152-Prymnesium_polylepis.1
MTIAVQCRSRVTLFYRKMCAVLLACCGAAPWANSYSIGANRMKDEGSRMKDSSLKDDRAPGPAPPRAAGVA